jgi:hypothetical protein
MTLTGIWVRSTPTARTPQLRAYVHTGSGSRDVKTPFSRALYAQTSGCGQNARGLLKAWMLPSREDTNIQYTRNRCRTTPMM